MNRQREWYLKHCAPLIHEKRVGLDLDIPMIMESLEEEIKYRPSVLFNNIHGYERDSILMNCLKRNVIERSLFENDEYSLRKLYQRYFHERCPNVEIVQRPGRYEKLASLDDVPVIKHQPKDAGRYITAGVTATRSPRTHKVNLGIYRMQVRDRNKLMIFMNEKSHGYKNYIESLRTHTHIPVTIFIGCNPVYYLVGAGKFTDSEDSYDTCAGLSGRDVELIKSEIPYPSCAQYAISGVIGGEREEEGIFGEFKGYYSESRYNPIITVKSIYRARDAYYTSISPGDESGLSLTGMSNEIDLYFHLTQMGYKIDNINYSFKDLCEFTAVVNTQEPSSSLIRAVFKHDKRVKFVICGRSINHPWLELNIFPFRTIKEDYFYKGKPAGERIGFLFEERPVLEKVQIAPNINYH